jgi:hypothetical protein
MKMPFGKFRGVLIEELPADYLDWLHSLDNLHERLRNAVESEWRHRQGEGPSANFPRELDPDDRLLLREMLRAGYRAMALKYHPDRGGPAEAMLRLNRLMERLRQETFTA